MGLEQRQVAQSFREVTPPSGSRCRGRRGSRWPGRRGLEGGLDRLVRRAEVDVIGEVGAVALKTIISFIIIDAGSRSRLFKKIKKVSSQAEMTSHLEDETPLHFPLSDHLNFL